MGKYAGMKTILVDFSGWTSAHGIPHIGSAEGTTLRVFWTIVTLASLGTFSWQMSLLIQKYISYSTSIQTELKFEKRVFPTVTVCNLNPVKDVVATETSGDNGTSSTTVVGEDIHTLADKFSNLRNSTYGLENEHADLADWGFDASKGEQYNQEMAMTQLNFLSHEQKKDIGQMLYTKDDLVMNCAYNTKGCEDNDFEMKYYADYGQCLTFNGNGTYESTRAGPLYGLRLLLRVHQPYYQPYVKAAGVRVAVHTNTTPPFAGAFGYNTSPGFATSFGIRYLQTDSLPKPHGDCVTESPGSYYFDGDYVPEGCYRSCLNDKIIGTCGCYDPALAEAEMSGISCSAGLPATVSKNIKCVNELIAEFNVINDCQCQKNCKEEAYTVTVSTALWPSQIYSPPSCVNYDLTTKYWKEISKCIEWYSKNTLLIEVYYERMNYQIMKQVAAYGVVNLISDTGGQLGLWLGVSFITVMEFLSLAVLVLFYALCAKRKMGDEDIGEDEEDDDDDEGEANDEDDPVKATEGGDSMPPPVSG